MVGGGVVADIAKHSSLHQARDNASKTQSLMNRFKRELTEVKLKTNFQIEMDGFTKVADFFFNGFLVQSKINASYDDSSSVKRQVSQVLSQLSSMKNKVESDIISKQVELETFIHQA